MITESKNWKVRVTRPFLYAGQAQPVGAELTVPYSFARELIANNKAERVAEPAPAPDADEPTASALSKPAAEPAGEAAADSAPEPAARPARKGKPAA